MSIETNRNSIQLPADVSAEIIQKTQEGSAIMRLARKTDLPGRGAVIPVITSDPEAEWVGETEKKPVSNPGLQAKKMQAYKLAVIVPFSKEFTRDAKSLYDTLIKRLPAALSRKFDRSAFGVCAAPGENFDTFAACTKVALVGDKVTAAYDGLVTADADIGEHGGITSGYVFSPQGRALLHKATDANGRPLFTNSAQEGMPGYVLGAQTFLSRAAFKAGTAQDPAIVGVAGDWTQALYGTVEGVDVSFSDQATLSYTDENGEAKTVNLWQQNMIAVRAEIEVGFRADTDCFVLLTGNKAGA